MPCSSLLILYSPSIKKGPCLGKGLKMVEAQGLEPWTR
jgi:hypothetical protein